MITERQFIYLQDDKYYEESEDGYCAVPSKYCPALGIKEFNEYAFYDEPDPDIIIELSDFFVLRNKANYKKEDIEKEAIIIYPKNIIEYYEKVKDNKEWLDLISGKLQKENSKIYLNIKKLYDVYLTTL